MRQFAEKVNLCTLTTLTCHDSQVHKHSVVRKIAEYLQINYTFLCAKPLTIQNLQLLVRSRNPQPLTALRIPIPIDTLAARRTG